MTAEFLFDRVALIGIGLINSSIARGLRKHNLARVIVTGDIDPAHCARAKELGIVDEAMTDNTVAAKDADLVVIGTPIGAVGTAAQQIGKMLKPGAIVTDVGSVKQSVVQDIAPHLPKNVHFIPGHPIAGTENSGPDAGFAELFVDRYVVLTPPRDIDQAALGRLRAMWEKFGAMVETMDPAHHDRVLAITSHLPHLIAYTIVGTAADLGDDLKQEVIRYSASGFRDFTRIAASDPVMWRDIFMNNREAVLDIIQRFNEDLTGLQRAIRKGEAATLEKLFTRTRAIRRGIIQARQDTPEDVKRKELKG